MPLASRRFAERLILEHMAHGGGQNGELVATYDNIEQYGVRRQSIPEAIAVAEALGFVDVTFQGKRSYGGARQPSTYGLTWLPRCDRTPPSHRWKAIDSAKAAEIVVALTEERRAADREAKRRRQDEKKAAAA
jgi:hypothetical protein